MKYISNVLLLVALILTACGGGTPAATTPTDAPASSEEVSTTPQAEEAPDSEPASESDQTADDSAPDSEPVSDETDTTADEPAAASGTARTFTIVPEESNVSYAVGEVFIRDDNKFVTAVGITQQIEGEVYYDATNPQNSTVGTITIDISAFKSDSDRRDKAIQDQWLESATYPLATFVPTTIDGLPETYTDGEEITLQITGDLTVRETTQPVTFETVGQITGNEMTGKATTTIQMTNFGFEPPNIAGILKAENDAVLTFEFVARASEESTTDTPTDETTASKPEAAPEGNESASEETASSDSTGPASIELSVDTTTIDLPSGRGEYGQATIVAQLLAADGSEWIPADTMPTVVFETTFGVLSDAVKNVDATGRAEVMLKGEITGNADVTAIYVMPNDSEMSETVSVAFTRGNTGGVYEVPFEPGMDTQPIDMEGIGTVEIPGDIYDIPVVVKFTTMPIESVDTSVIPEGKQVTGAFSIDFYYPDGMLILEENVSFPTPMTITYPVEGMAEPSLAIWNLDREEWVDVDAEVSETSLTASMQTFGEYMKLAAN